jgi:hypothetical protein
VSYPFPFLLFTTCTRNGLWCEREQE